jgi:hypothetical protein
VLVFLHEQESEDSNLLLLLLLVQRTTLVEIKKGSINKGV